MQPSLIVISSLLNNEKFISLLVRYHAYSRWHREVFAPNCSFALSVLFLFAQKLWIIFLLISGLHHAPISKLENLTFSFAAIRKIYFIKTNVKSFENFIQYGIEQIILELFFKNKNGSLFFSLSMKYFLLLYWYKVWLFKPRLFRFLFFSSFLLHPFLLPFLRGCS